MMKNIKVILLVFIVSFSFLGHASGQLIECAPIPPYPNYTWGQILESADLEVLSTLNPVLGGSPISEVYDFNAVQIGNNWVQISDPGISLNNDDCENPFWEISSKSRIVGIAIFEAAATISFPSSITNLEDLTELTVVGGFEGSIPSGIWGMTELTFLDLSNNNLTGTLPNTVNQLTKLTALNLQGNNFNGEIPALSLPLLEWLNLDNNGFSGEVPETIWTMTKLSNLSLRNNNLSGEIPNNVNQLINLEFLSISDNSFEGELPDISLPKLRYLELNNNEFTGTVPTPPNVETLNLRGNNFHGMLPDDLLENGNLLILDIFDNAFNAWQFLPDWQDDISALQNIGVTINTANQRYREVGLVTLYTGIVQIRRWNTDFHETEIFNVSPGMKIFEGDEIRTGVSSGVDIKFIDGSFMTLGNKSSFLVERYTDRRTKPTIFRFLEGIIENFTSGEPDYYEYLREQNKKPLYIINKRGGASGVRGTIFSMRYETIDEIEYQIIDMSEGIVDVYDITTGQVTSVSGTDTLQNPVEISEGVKAIHFWIDIAGLLDENTGILSKPFGKNITNLEKLASNLKLHKADNKRLTFGSNEASGTHATQIEQLSPNSRRISVEFLRRTDIQELSYAPMYSTNLTGDWVPFDVPVSVTPIDFNWEKVRCEVVLSDINSPIFTAILYQYD